MALFSERHGFKKPKDTIQIEGMDNDLRTGIWNAMTLCYWNNVTADTYYYHEDMTLFCERLWANYLKHPLDFMGDSWNPIYRVFRKYFFDCQWSEVYDFIEFTSKNYPGEEENSQFRNLCNTVLEQELSGYRFVGNEIVKITSAQEISAIESALEDTNSLGPVSTHLATALKLLSDRKTPDYRNSIKESISAVESLSKIITGKPKSTLGDALKELEKTIPLHGALKRAFSNLYGYTSDADGIRHALMDDANLQFEDAKFMLISCSGFVSYLIALAAKAEIDLQKRNS